MDGQASRSGRPPGGSRIATADPHQLVAAAAPDDTPAAPAATTTK
jgi:hypothetical protein